MLVGLSDYSLPRGVLSVEREYTSSYEFLRIFPAKVDEGSRFCVPQRCGNGSGRAISLVLSIQTVQQRRVAMMWCVS